MWFKNKSYLYFGLWILTRSVNGSNTDQIYLILYSHLFKIFEYEYKYGYVSDIKIENYIQRNPDMNIFQIFFKYQIQKKTDINKIWICKKKNINRV